MTSTQLRPDASATARPGGPLLSIENLTVRYGETDVVHDVSLQIAAGESLALVGQSGSGKSTIANAILRLGTGEATGAIRLDGTETVGLGDRAFRRLLRSDIAYIPQFPLSSLNPTRRIGRQLAESFAAAVGRRVDRDRLVDSLVGVGIADPARALHAYPHELSGGQLQRVLIAMAIAKKPRLIIADEPTSALDISLRRSILDLLRVQQLELGSSILLITHDLSVAKALTQSAVILKDGRVVERGESVSVLERPTSDYGRMLLASVPEQNVHRYDRAREVRTRSAGGPVIAVDRVSKSFVSARSTTVALDDVSFTVPRGTTFALVGESGSGKTTLARSVLGLVRPDSGTVSIGGSPVDPTDADGLRVVRRHLQLVYQDGSSSLDPRYSALRAVAEPLQRFGIVASRRERLDEAARLLEAVGLGSALYASRPGQLSGGQRQRVAIARALATRPDVVVLDEPTSALDVSVQAQIVDLLVQLQADFDLSYLLVSHDLGLVRQFADSVAVMRNGAIVEQGAVRDVYEDPKHPFTQTLIENSFLG